MLAEAIVVADGDLFLQEPMDINEPGMPELPPLTWTQMSHLHRELEFILRRGPDRPGERLQITGRTLPGLPPLDSADMAQVKMHLERILKDP
jgi:hypothetical protein